MCYARGFSLIELLIVTFIISMGVVGLLSVVGDSTTRMDRIRKDVIATNLAREGIEAVYNIRDTNRLRWSDTEGCRLKRHPLDDGHSTCQDGERLAADTRYRLEHVLSNQSKHWIAIPNSNTPPILNIKDNGVTLEQNFFRLCQDIDNVDDDTDDAGDNQRYSCPTPNNSTTLHDGDLRDTQPPEGLFFRGVHVKGLYNKTTGAALTCPTGNDPNCNNSTPKELVFCVKVEYVSGGIGTKEICASMTNHLD